MMKIPFSTISKIHLTDTHLYTLVAVMLDGIETYRYLKQAIHYNTVGEITVDFIVYETTFTDKTNAYAYWQKMYDIRLVKGDGTLKS